MNIAHVTRDTSCRCDASTGRDKLAAAAVRVRSGASCDIDISLLNVIKWAFSSIYLGSGQTGAGDWGACWGQGAKTELKLSPYLQFPADTPATARWWCGAVPAAVSPQIPN